MHFTSKIIGSIFLLSILFAHKFFISTTDIQIKPEEERAEITIQVFSHDVYLLLENANYKTINVGTDKESADIDIFLVNYLSENFMIQDYRWKYLGKEIGLEYTVFFLEIDNFSPSSNVAILNSLFMDLYNEQRNIINLYNGDSLQSASMTNNEPVFSFSVQ